MFPDLTRDDVFRLETRRLWLRWPRQADAPAVTQLAGEKVVAEMTGVIPHPFPAGEAERFVLAAREANMEGRRLTMAITPRAKPSQLIGVVGIKPDATGAAELGYWIGSPHWGQGFATEAARSLVDAFFAYTDGQELTASVRVINPDSRRVLEKCGFASVGSGLESFPARGGLLPADHFRLDRRKWESFKVWRASDYVPSAAADEGGVSAAAAH
ncbi:MAG: GCN5-related N-acetyltransferase [Enterovirga sp.]|nr:GCN5-related N-acetyltransferase [Enterovirga sp.]